MTRFSDRGTHAHRVLTSRRRSPRVVNAVVAVSLTHCQLLAPFFRDVVDVLIGWRLDPALPESLRKTITALLGHLQPLWHADATTSEETLSEFVEDMQAVLPGSPKADATLFFALVEYVR